MTAQPEKGLELSREPHDDKKLVERLRRGANCVGFLDGAPEPAADVANMLRNAADAIERLAPPSLEAAGWRTIGSAPQDGTRILVDFGRCGVHAVAWKMSVRGYEIWCVDDCKHGPYPLRGYVDTDVRGWMPLPCGVLQDDPAPPDEAAAPSPEIERIVGEIEKAYERTANSPDAYDNARLWRTFCDSWWPALRAALKSRGDRE